MIRKLRRDDLQAEAQSIVDFLQANGAAAPLAALSMKAKLDSVQHELAELDAEVDDHGSVALFFSGGRVEGSRAIDAEFATGSLHAYQELVLRTAVQRARGPLASRGPVPDRDLARLNIVSTVPGSFGFVLEEAGSAQRPIFPTVVKDAIETVTGFLQSFASPDELLYAAALEDLDQRALLSLKDLLRMLKEAGSTIRVVEGEHDLRLDLVSVERAYQRADQSSVEEQEVELEGRLIGFLPSSRRFEFAPDDYMPSIAGRVSSQLSSELLERVTEESVLLGERFKAHLLVRVFSRRGSEPRSTYTLLALTDVDNFTSEREA